MTFEKVLEVFKDYLAEDKVCEVISTSRGYTVMYWDERLENWYGVTYFKTPEVMRDTFLDSYFDHLEEIYTKNNRELSESEQIEVNASCEKLRNQCQ